MNTETEVRDYMKLHGYQFGEPEYRGGEDKRAALINHQVRNELSARLAQCELEHVAQLELGRARVLGLYRDLQGCLER